MPATKIRLVLASRSPRRRDILKAAGVPHQVIDAGVDDALLDAGRVDPGHWVTALAYLKASAGCGVWHATHPNERAVILGADTVCVADDDIIGKPADADEARATILRFREGQHRVLTGVALLDTASRDRELLVRQSIVRFGPIPDAAVDRYIESEGWRDKAGAYNLFERIDEGWPIAYDGEPGTIVGLPIEALLPRLDRLGVDLGAGARR